MLVNTRISPVQVPYINVNFYNFYHTLSCSSRPSPWILFYRLICGFLKIIQLAFKKVLVFLPIWIGFSSPGSPTCNWRYIKRTNTSSFYPLIKSKWLAECCSIVQRVQVAMNKKYWLQVITDRTSWNLSDLLSNIRNKTSNEARKLPSISLYI